MSEQQSNQSLNNLIHKKEQFKNTITEIQNSNFTILKEISDRNPNKDFHLLENHYYLIISDSNKNEISFGINEDSNLPEILKMKMKEAFEMTFH